MESNRQCVARACAVVIASIAVLVSTPPAQAENCLKPSALDQKSVVKLHVIDVGQGDALAVTCQDGSIGMIVDSGDKKEEQGFARMKAYFHTLAGMSPKRNSVPLFVATHPDADHIGGATWVFSEFSVKVFLDDGRPVGTKTYLNLRALAQRQEGEGTLRYLHAGAGPRSFEICPGVNAEVVTPPAVFSSCESNNECSIMLRVTHGSVSFLLTGDAGKGQERAVLDDEAASKRLRASVLKVGHHGSQSSSSGPFLRAVKPGCAVISSGRPGEGTNQRYKHPRAAVVDALLEEITLDRPGPIVLQAYARKGGFSKRTVGRCLYHTAVDGTVVFSTDGKRLACEAGK